DLNSDSLGRTSSFEKVKNKKRTRRTSSDGALSVFRRGSFGLTLFKSNAEQKPLKKTLQKHTSKMLSNTEILKMFATFRTEITPFLVERYSRELKTLFSNCFLGDNAVTLMTKLFKIDRETAEML